MILGLAFTEQGLKLLSQINLALNKEVEIFNSESTDTKLWIKEHFNKSRAIIFVGATGIAVRMVAPLLKGKDKDPAVIVIDELGHFIIPLLSGHLGGANLLASQLANILKGTLVLTTATDINNKFAIDSWARANNCTVANPENIKYISSAVLRDKTVGFYSDFPVNGALNKSLTLLENGELGVCISLNEKKQPFNITLNLVPKIVHVGLGCRLGTDYNSLNEFFSEKLNKLEISIKALAGFSSIDLKKDENCFIRLQETYQIPFVFYKAQDLKNLLGTFQSSAFVKKITGVDNICERCAQLNSGGKIILNKTIGSGFTIALALKPWQVNFENNLEKQVF